MFEAKLCLKRLLGCLSDTDVAQSSYVFYETELNRGEEDRIGCVFPYALVLELGLISSLIYFFCGGSLASFCV